MKTPHLFGPNIRGPMRFPFEDQERYKLLRQVGEGIFGVSLLVHDQEEDKEVLLRIFEREVPQDLEYFRREITALARLSHPNLIPYLEPVRQEDVMGYTRAFIQGTEIRKWIAHASPELLSTKGPDQALDLHYAQMEQQLEGISDDLDEAGAIIVQVSQSGPYPAITERSLHREAFHRADFATILKRTIQIFPDLIRGLEHLHHYKRAHGLLYPGCLVVDDEDQQAKVADFGLTTWLLTEALQEESVPQSDPEAERSLQRRQRALLYRAPELFSYEAPPTPQSDIYSLGCILYEILTNHPPYDKPWTSRGTNEMPLPIFRHEPTCPSSWACLIEQMIETDPERRPTLQEVAQFFERCDSIPTQLAPTFTPPPATLFGYHQELDSLMHRIEIVERSNQPHDMMMVGAKGEGKAHLLRHLANQLTRRGWVILNGHCMEQSLDFYDGWNAIFQQLTPLLSKLPTKYQAKVERSRRIASTLFPQLIKRHETLSKKESPAPSEDSLKEVTEGRLSGTQLAEMRFEATRALRTLLQMIGEQRPLLIILENIEFAPRDTLQLLHDLRADSEDWRVMMMLTSSDWKLAKTFPSMQQSGMDTLTLPGFRKPAALRFLQHLHKVDTETLIQAEALLQDDLHYPPLLLKELAHSVRSGTMSMEEVKNKQLLQPKRKDGSFEPTLKKIYQKRISSLSKPASELLRCIALFPQETVPFSTIEAYVRDYCAECSSTSLINELVKKRLVRRARSSKIPVYQTAHEIVQTILIKELKDGERQNYYDRLLEIMSEDSFGVLRFELLRHSERQEDAMIHFEREFDHALKRLAFARAASLQQWFLDHQGKMSLRDRLRYKRTLANLEACDRRFEEAALRFESCADVLAPGVERTQDLHDAALMHFAAGSFELALKAAQEALKFFGEDYIGNPKSNQTVARFRFRLFRLRGWRHLALGSLRAQSFSPEQTLQHRLYTLALETQGMLNGEQALGFDRKMWRQANQSHDRSIYADASLFHAQLLLQHSMKHASHHVPQLLEEAQTLYEEQDNWARLTRIATLRLEISLLQGDYAKAVTHYEQATHLWQKVQSPERLTRTNMFYLKGLLFLEQGEPQKVEPYIRQLLFEERQYGPARVRAGQLRFGRALLQGDCTQAELELDHIQRMISTLVPSELQLWCVCAETMLNLALGRPEVAIGKLDMARDALEGTLFFHIPRFRYRFELHQAYALMTSIDRYWAADPGRITRYRSKLNETIRKLKSLRPHAAVSERLALDRIVARCTWLKNKPQRALNYLEGAIQKHAHMMHNALDSAKFAEARSTLLRVIEGDGSEELLEQTHMIYDMLGIPSPLLLEGWPIPPELSALVREDAPGNLTV